MLVVRMKSSRLRESGVLNTQGVPSELPLAGIVTVIVVVVMTPSIFQAVTGVRISRSLRK